MCRRVKFLPIAADLHHTLGLLLVRKINPSAALNEFVEAVKLEPDNPQLRMPIEHLTTAKCSSIDCVF
jgi:hypothetical protein